MYTRLSKTILSFGPLTVWLISSQLSSREVGVAAYEKIFQDLQEGIKNHKKVRTYILDLKVMG